VRLERNAQALLLSFQHHCVILVHHTDTCRNAHILLQREGQRERDTLRADNRKRGKGDLERMEKVKRNGSGVLDSQEKIM